MFVFPPRRDISSFGFSENQSPGKSYRAGKTTLHFPRTHYSLRGAGSPYRPGRPRRLASGSQRYEPTPRREAEPETTIP